MTASDSTRATPQNTHAFGTTVVLQMAATVFFTAAAIAAIVAILTYKHGISSLLQERSSGVTILARSFDTGELTALHGEAADTETEAHRRIKKRLHQVHIGNPNVIVAQLLRHDTGTGRTICLVNAPKPGQPDDLPPGIPVHTDTASAAAIHNLAQSGKGDVRIITDTRHRHTQHSYSVVEMRPSPGGETIMDIAYYKVDVTPRIKVLLLSAGQRAAGIMLFFCLPLVVYLVARGNTQQERTLLELMMAIDQSENGIAVSTPDKHMAYVNEGMVRQRGHTREELMRMNWWEHFAEEQKDTDRQWRALFAPGAKPYSIDVRLRRKNGDVFPARIAGTPIYDKKNKNKVICSISFCTDLTEPYKINRLLEQAKQHAKEASRSKSAFLAMMSHEVRTPLNGIIGFSSLLLDTPLTPDQAARVRTMRKHGETLVQLATNILDMSRIESGDIQPEIRECNPATLVMETLAAAAAENIPAAHTQFRPIIAPGVPELLLVDFDRLTHVLTNLVNTAAKHTPAGTVEVSLRPATCPPAPDVRAFLLEISVRGTGSPPAAPAGLDPAPPGPLSLMIARHLTGLMGCEIIRDHRDPSQFVFTFTIRCKLHAR